MAKKIEIICETGIMVPWKNLKEYQGNLKELSRVNFEKLKRIIIEDGFAAPIFIWKGKNYILDGHQRIRVLESLIKEGYVDPVKMPCVNIVCRDEKHAKKLILDFASIYGKATDEGFYQFLAEADMLGDFDELKKTIDLPDIDNDKFQDGYLEEVEIIEPPELEISPELHERHDYLVFYFDNEFDWQVVCEKYDVKTVQGTKVGKSTLKNSGIGRVLPGKVLLD
jgi:hypothetical protein